MSTLNVIFEKDEYFERIYQPVPVNYKVEIINNHVHISYSLSYDDYYNEMCYLPSDDDESKVNGVTLSYKFGLFGNSEMFHKSVIDIFLGHV